MPMLANLVVASSSCGISPIFSRLFFYFMKDKKDHMLGQTRGAVHLLILPTHSLTWWLLAHFHVECAQMLPRIFLTTQACVQTLTAVRLSSCLHYIYIKWSLLSGYLYNRYSVIVFFFNARRARFTALTGHVTVVFLTFVARQQFVESNSLHMARFYNYFDNTEYI
jgi:hypothetical protein